MSGRQIILKKVKVHNLKSVDLTLDSNELVVFTGVSGSGKSSMAFDTIFAEGQRRYIESLSTFARRQIGEFTKPDLEHASGISPTISIEQKSGSGNPRSTVGTLTEIYDYMRVLYARVGVPHCPVSGEAVSPQSKERIIHTVQHYPDGKKIVVLFPYAKEKKAEFKEDFQELMRKGFTRVRVDGKIVHLDESIALDGTVAHDVDVVVDRLVVNKDSQSRIAEALIHALTLGSGICSILDPEQDEEELFSMQAFSPASGISYTSLEPHDFSFNSPSGMCSRCSGLGYVQEFDLEQIIDSTKSIAEDCCSIASSYQTVRYGNIYDNLAAIFGFSVHTSWKKLSKEARKVFLYGTEKKWTRMQFIHPVTGVSWVDHIQWRGVLYEAQTRYAEAKSEVYRKKMQKLMHEGVCPECQGSRLKPYPSFATFLGKRIFDLTSMTIGELHTFFEEAAPEKQDLIIAEELLKEVLARLKFLVDVGLDYLTLDRIAPTLSGGEVQRVRLASQIGCGLVGITYILDEPSIGLHPRDNKRLIQTLKHLRDMGNTVVVVEHDEETIWAADRVVDFGPGAGSRGGEIVVNGDLSTFIQCKSSLTAGYLTGRLSIPIPKKRRKKSNEFLEVIGANHHNLKNVHAKIPLGMFVAITGVSGSGKSSLISDILYPSLANYLHGAEQKVGLHEKIKGVEKIDKVIAIDQSPIGRNPRSNPATYVKVFDEIRDLFSRLPESLARGFKPGRFSFNVQEGSCPHCSGMGMVELDMDFMEAAWIECPECKGHRFDTETLSVLYKGKNIYDVLEMEVGEALQHFINIPSLRHKLETLQQVGLEYIKIGQSSTTLSGGEAQRIKLAKELARPGTGRTLYILDEPTTGLHFHDIRHLLEVLQALVERGNSVIVIEHNMDVVKTADWIIDLGPDGGSRGGEIVATGTPEALAKLDTPTGHAIREALHCNPESKVEAVLKEAKKAQKSTVAEVKSITILGAEQNNLKRIDAVIPREKITLFTGPSGSGKSSLAFETIYAEGQRRYVESLSPYARQFVRQMPKPKLSLAEGLSPAIAIEQKSHAGNPRSTIGTLTEIYDYLRVLYACIGIPHDPGTGEEIRSISKDFVVSRVLSLPEGEKIQILSPIEIKRTEKFVDIINRLQRQGYVRIRLNGTFYNLEDDFSTFPYDRKRKNELYLVVDRLKVDSSMEKRLYEAVSTAAKLGGNQLLVLHEENELPFNLAFGVESSGKSYKEITPHTFAFNTAEGMCPDCLGLGCQYGADLTRRKELMMHSVGAILRLLWREKFSRPAYELTEKVLAQEGINLHAPLSSLTAPQLQILMNGSSSEDQWCKSGENLKLRWIGINAVFAKASKSASSDMRESIMPLLDEQECLSCKGSRLNPLARHVTIEKLSIHHVCQLPINQSLLFVEKLKLDRSQKKLLEEVMKQLVSRLRFLVDVGLQYLSLERRAPTLSGGETQRIRLARQLGGGLTGVLYVLDEPSIGLHPRDNQLLNRTLKKLNELGNTLLLVEHDPLSIQLADYMLDFGPGAGVHGGHVMARGTLKQILRNPRSLTGKYLSGKLTIPSPESFRGISKGTLSICNVSLFNIQKMSLEIPLATMTTITGVSGSGKSTLIQHILLPAIEQGLYTNDSIEIAQGHVKGISQIDRLLSIDQNPIGHTVRSDVGTYVDVLTRMRDFFSTLPIARSKGLLPRHFSYNHRKGMCSHCWGLGYRKIEMHFLPAVKVLCSECKGMRLNPVSLEILYAGRSFGQYLDSTVEEVRAIFENHPRVTRILDTLISVGLGYLKLGQEMATLSGGEAQRIKLSRELSKRATGKTLYLLDEPTTGLHPDDIAKLLGVLQRLVDKGNSVIIIEHNTDVIRNSDYIIELGPGAGEEGGRVVCVGNPDEIRENKKSIIAPYIGLSA